MGNKRGFTLIEILLTMGIVSILMAIVIIAINPARQFAQSNNTKRRSDVSAILNAIGQYQTDNLGVLPAGITTSAQTISDTGANLCSLIVTRYLAELPADPSVNGGTAITNCGAAYNTGYTVIVGAADSRITVAAPQAELTETISVTR